MSKRKRQVDQRLNELFSIADEPPAAGEAAQPAGVAQPIGMAATPGADLILLKAAIDQLPLPAYLKDREHTWVAVNAAFAQLLGQAPAALLGYTDKEQADEAWQLDDRVLESGIEETTQETIPLPDGTIRTRRTRRTPLAGAETGARYVMGVLEDEVTPTPVSDSAETFHAALNAMPSPVIVSRIADDVILYANQAFSTLTAVPLEQLTSKRAASFYAGVQDWERARQQDELHGYEVRLRRADGSIVWVSLSMCGLKFNAEDCVITTLADISIRKQAEVDLRGFQQGLEYSTAAIFMTDRDGVITYVNPAFEKIYGFTRAEAIGQTPRIIKSGLIPSEQYTHFWATLLAGQTVAGEITNRAKDGRLVPIEGSNNPIWDEYGEIVGFLALHTDISLRKQVEDNLVTRNRQLAAINLLGQQLATLVTAQEVVERVFAASGEIVDNRNLTIALYDERKQEISFPVYTVAGERRAVAGRPFGHGITEHVLTTKKTLWIPRDVPGFAASSGVVSLENPAQCYLGVPLLSGDKALGVIALQDYDREEVYSPADVELVSTIAAQTAAALENARLHATEARRAVQQQTAAEISTAAGTILDVSELLPFVVNLIQQRFGLYYVGLFLLDEARQNAVLRAGTGEAGQRMLERQHHLPLDDRSMIGWCIQRRGPRIALDVGKDAVRFNNPDLPDTRSELALPLVSRGQVLGAMTVQSAEVAAFSEQDIAILQTMSDQVAIAIENARLIEQTERRAQREARLNLIAQQLRQTTDIHTILQTATEQLSLALDTSHAQARLSTVRHANGQPAPAEEDRS